MKSYRGLAWKELLAQKMTASLIGIAILLSTMMTTIIGQSVGILSAMRERQAIAIGGNCYATFVQMNREQVQALQDEKRLSYTGVSIYLGNIELNRALSLGLVEYLGDSLEVYPTYSRIKEGRLPERAMEIALPEDVLQFLGFTGAVGDRISLSASKALRHGIEINTFDYSAEFILTGITESNYLGYAYGAVTGIVGEGTANQILPESFLYYNVDIRTAEKRQFQNVMNDLCTALQVHELDMMYNVVYLNVLGISFDLEAADREISDQGFSFLIMAGVLVGGLLLLAAGFVIYNILKIAVTKQIRQYGILRAIGGEKQQLYRIVITEVSLLCLVGIPAGMLLGLLAAKGVLTAAAGLLSPDVFLVQSSSELNQLIAENSSGKGWFLLLSAGITLFFAYLAAIPAAHFAANVSPIAALAGGNSKIRRKKRKEKRIRNFEAYYAWLNLRRNRGRTVITILSLAMSIAVFIALQGFLSLMDVTKLGEMDHLGDYSMINETIGFSLADLRELEADENIEAVAAMQFALYEQDKDCKVEGISLGFDLQAGETFQVVGLNKIYMEDFFGKRLSAEQVEALNAGNGCIVRNPLRIIYQGEEFLRTNILAGSSIKVSGKEITVFDTLDDYDPYLSVGNGGFYNGIQVIVNEHLYTELTGRENYAEFLPILAEGGDREAVDGILEQICQRTLGSTVLSYEESDRQLKESFAQTNMLAWGIILLIGLIGVLNIINTVYTNIHTRMVEIGIQRAIGMSIGSLYRTFLWEGAYYGLIAALFGGLVGYLCLIFVEAGMVNEIRLVAFPVGAMIEVSLVSVGTCLAATQIPLRKMGRMDIVEGIEVVD